MVYPECPSFAASIRETCSLLCAIPHLGTTHIPVGQTTAGPPNYYALSCLYQAREIRRWRQGLPVQSGWYISPSILSLPNELAKKGLRSSSLTRRSPCRPSLRHLKIWGVYSLVAKAARKGKADNTHPVSQRLPSCMSYSQG